MFHQKLIHTKQFVAVVIVRQQQNRAIPGNHLFPAFKQFHTPAFNICGNNSQPRLFLLSKHLIESGHIAGNRLCASVSTDISKFG